MFVLDASVALAWCFEDEATRASEAVLDLLSDDQASVPPIWELEVANVLLVAERRGRISEAAATRFLGLLRGLPIVIDEAPDLAVVMAAGRRHGLSSYDAAYLVLAEGLGAPLATLDDALTEAATAAGVPLLVTR